MLDPHGLYEIDTEVEVAAGLGPAARGTGPVLVNALRGLVDAGSTGELAIQHLLSLSPTSRLVTFDIDQLLDYRSKRPTMVFDSNAFSDYDAPLLAIDVAHDDEGTAFLVLHGSEPDVQWERFVAAVCSLIERFDVSLTVGAYGIPMGIPHTRAISSTAHATDSALIGGATSWFGRVRVPASVANLLELRLGQRGRDALSYAVHVPHYLAQAAFPPAAITALNSLEGASGLSLRVSDLAPAAAEAIAAIERQVGESPEVAEVVRGLEEQYDAFTRSSSRGNLLADAAPIPTADELGAEFERFLAQQGPESQQG